MIQIRIDYTCQRCGGSGVEDDPEGFGYTAMYAAARSRTPTGAPGAVTRIYNEMCFQHKLELDLDEFPPEEGPCRACDGTGRRVDEFSEEDLRRGVELLHRQALGAKAAPLPSEAS